MPPLDGECNWWGNATGPSGAGSGTGSTVSTNVDFLPWLLTSDLDGACSAETVVTSVLMNPSTGTTGTTVTVSSSATDPNGLRAVYYNLFTPAGVFICNIAYNDPIPGAP